MHRLCSLSSTAAILSCALVATAQAAGPIKAAYVEEVIPSHTFNDQMSLSTKAKAVGPGAGTAILGVTSLTFTNTDSARQLVLFFTASISGTECGGASLVGAVETSMYVVVAANSTLHLTYPTPWIVNPWQGYTCFGAKLVNPLHAGGDLLVNVVGVLN